MSSSSGSVSSSSESSSTRSSSGPRRELSAPHDISRSDSSDDSTGSDSSDDSTRSDSSDDSTGDSSDDSTGSCSSDDSTGSHSSDDSTGSHSSDDSTGDSSDDSTGDSSDDSTRSDSPYKNHNSSDAFGSRSNSGFPPPSGINAHDTERRGKQYAAKSFSEYDEAEGVTDWPQGHVGHKEDFERLTVSVLEFQLTRKARANSGTTVFNKVKHVVDYLRKQVPRMAAGAGYGPDLSIEEAISKINRSIPFIMFSFQAKACLGKAGYDSACPNGIYEGYMDMMMKSTGIGVFGMRTLVFLLLVSEAGFGPRPGSWVGVRKSNAVLLENGRWKITLFGIKRRDRARPKFPLYVSEETSRMFSLYMEMREYSDIESESKLGDNLFFGTEPALCKAIQDITERIGLQRNTFSGKSTRFATHNQNIAQAMLDPQNPASFVDASSASIARIQWKTKTNSDHYVDVDLVETVLDAQRKKRNYDELEPHEFYQDPLQQQLTDSATVYARRVEKTCSNDGVSCKLQEATMSLHARLVGETNMQCSEYTSPFHMERCQDIGKAIFDGAFDLSDSATRALDGWLQSFHSPGGHVTHKRGSLVNILIRHLVLKDSNWNAFEVPEYLIVRVSLPQNVCNAYSATHTKAGKLRKRLTHRSVVPCEPQACVGQLMPPPPTCRTKEQQDFLKGNVENRATVNGNRCCSEARVELVHVWPLGLEISKEFDTPSGRTSYGGVVHGVSKGEEGILYHVRYEDRDDDNMDPNELNIFRHRSKGADKNSKRSLHVYPINMELWLMDGEPKKGHIRRWEQTVDQGCVVRYDIAFSGSEMTGITHEAIEKDYSFDAPQNVRRRTFTVDMW